MIFGGLTRKQGTLAEKFVEERRREESKVNHLNAYLKTDLVARHVATWEDKGAEMNRNRFMKQRITQLRKEFEQKNAMRRRKLKQLYDQEEKMYEIEIRKMRPTHEQIKQDMIDKVKALKEKRESQRQREVEERLDRRFKQSADELRKIESDVKEIQTKHERDIQMIEKQRKMEREYAEEMVYAELWRRDADNKFRTEREKEREAFLKNQARNQILENQYSTLLRKKQEEKQQHEKEKSMLRNQWQEDARRARDELLSEKVMNKTLNNEIFRENLIRKKMKEEELQREKEVDKRMIDDIVERERQIAMAEAAEKERHKQETIDYLKNFKNRSDEVKLNQDHLDKLLEEEREKQWKKQKDQWEKEEKARINLLYDVYNDRASAIGHKQRLKEEEERRKAYERSQVTHEIQNHNEDVKRQDLEEMLKMRQHQNTILWQVNEKREKDRKKLLEEMEDERLRRLKELQYQMRIDQEKEKGRRLLEQTKRNRLY